MRRHLLVGLSTRALAESAVKSCHNVLTLDYFGDQDQKARVENFSLAREYHLPFSAENLLIASNDFAFDTVTYTANLENHPNVVAALAKRGKLAGNGPETISRIRDWSVLREFCTKNAIPHPPTLLPGEESQATSKYIWLSKPVNGGGGRGIQRWDGGPLNDSSVLQARVEGVPASAAFVADGEKAVVIGLTRQLNGYSEFGVSGYNWCGNILPLPLEADKTRSILGEVEDMLNRLTRNFGLKGVGGMDFVISEDVDGKLRPFLLEINPRYTGSMELIEWAYGLNIYSLHLEACEGRLPGFILSEHLNEKYYGKGIVFARQDVFVQDNENWSELGRRDIPFPGDKINQGHPVCTVLASGDTYDDCYANLCISAEDVRREIGDTEEG